MIRVDVKPPRIATKKSGLSEEQVNKLIKISLRESCRLVRDYARSHHKYKDDPERAKEEGYIGLTRAIHYKLIKKAKQGIVYINEKEAPYAKYQVYGIKGHTARFASRMRWYSYRKQWRGWWRREEVRGIRGDNFLKKAYKNTRDDVNDIFEYNLRRMLNGKL